MEKDVKGDYTFIFTVAEGRNLFPCNTSNSASPYCAVKLGGKKYKTKKVKNSLNPKWDESGQLIIPQKQAPESIFFDLYDYHRVYNNKRMGRATFPLSGLSDTETNTWLKLEQRGNEDVSGEIRVIMRLQKTAPSSKPGTLRSDSGLKSSSDDPPLFSALKSSDMSLVQKLLREGTDVNQMDNDGFTPLHTASLISSDMDDLIMCELLRHPKINVNAGNKDGSTPLHYFAQNYKSPNADEPFTMFIEKGANVNIQNIFGETPLHKAIFNKPLKVIMVNLLIGAGADVNIQTTKGISALHYAVWLAREDLVRVLLKAGANIKLADSEKNRTPYQIAVQERMDEIAKLLRKVLDLYEWLDNLNLSKHKSLLLKEELFLDLLPEVDENTLVKLGISDNDAQTILREANKIVIDQGGAFSEPAAKTLEQELEEMKHINKEKHWILKDSSQLEFLGKLGHGASGTVYKGLFQGKEVAIKVLKTDSVATMPQKDLDEFKKEFQIMSTIQSPETVFFFGASLEPRVCMVMELMHRGSLYHVMNDKSVEIGWPRVFSFATWMVKGMDNLHSNAPQIVHRDFKSLNVMVNDRFQAKVGDFGLSRIHSESMNFQQTFQRMVGTMAYCAPECYSFSKDSTESTLQGFTPASDVHSIAIVLWELVMRCITGVYQRPYKEFPRLVMDFQIIVQVSKNALRPTIAPTCPESFKRLIQDTWNQSPKLRPTCKEILQRLAEMQQEYAENTEAWEKTKLPPPQEDTDD